MRIPVVGYEGLYEVDDEGNVYRVAPGPGAVTGRRLKPEINSMGYYRVGLCLNGKRRRHFVHRLLAIHFIPNPDSFPHINHLNGDKTNNRVSNLEWCDHGYNMRHARDVLGHYGGQLPICVIGVNIETGKYLTFKSMGEAARFVNGCSINISLVCRGKRKHHKGWHWLYLSE